MCCKSGLFNGKIQYSPAIGILKYAHSLTADGTIHSVGRVLSFFSSRRNWDSPNPSPAGDCAHPPPPRLVPGGGVHSLAREGLGKSQFRRWDIHCGTLCIYVLCGTICDHAFLLLLKSAVTLTPPPRVFRLRLVSCSRRERS